ncbi:MAG TPA: hypothetical protein EYQ81_13595 [Sneathiellales bacterium]|nr:hypothetical protein [Sneathiellales bacterium]
MQHADRAHADRHRDHPHHPPAHGRVRLNEGDGRLHGATEYFYDNKKLKAQIFYRKGKEEGEWKYFDRDGILAKRIYYEAGRVIDK